MKKCFKCGKEKEIEQFYKHKQMGDGHLGKCKTCTKKDVAERYADPTAIERIREYERMRFQDPKRKAKLREYSRKMREKSRGKSRARGRLHRAIKLGLVVKQICKVCSNPKAQAHHTDYRKPLNVQWLCFKHHREEHGQKPRDYNLPHQRPAKVLPF